MSSHWIALLCMLPAAVMAGENETPKWLQEAERVAASIDEGQAHSERRADALTRVALQYARSGELAKAKALADRLPKKQRTSALTGIAIELTRVSKFSEAIEAARDSGYPYAEVAVVVIQSRTDPDGAMRRARKLPEPRKSKALGKICKEQVLAGRPKKAADALSGVIDEKRKREASIWLSMALAASAGGDLGDALEDHGLSTALAGHRLVRLLEGSLNRNDLKNAERVLAALTDSHQKASGCIAMAEHHLSRKEKAKFEKYVGAALAEAPKISDPITGALARSAIYSRAAQLLVQAEQYDRGVKVMVMGQKALQEQEEPVPGFFDGLGVNKLLVGLMIMAGRIEEAKKTATAPDGTIDAGMVPMLVAAYSKVGDARAAEALIEMYAEDKEVLMSIYLALAADRAEPTE